jgi:GNAT superfamily N-acetyltransferase
VPLYFTINANAGTINRDFLKNPMNASKLITEEEFIANGLDRGLMVTKLPSPGNLGWKIVESSNPNTIISWITFCPPQPLDGRSEEEQIRDLKREIDESKTFNSKESVFNMRMEHRMLGERYFGKGYESRLWELWGLATDEKWQRRGLASKLVEWAMGKMEEVTRASEGGEGVYITASQAGQRTYEKASFEKIENQDGIEVKPKKLSHIWFVKSFV